MMAIKLTLLYMIKIYFLYFINRYFVIKNHTMELSYR